MKYTLLLLTILSITCLCFSAKSQQIVFDKSKTGLIGTVYSDATAIDYFKGFKHIAGSVLNINYIGDTTYVLQHLYKANRHIIIFSKQVDTTNPKKYLILDTVIIRGGEELFGDKYWITLSDCTLTGKYDDELFAVVLMEDKGYLDKYKWAFRANKSTGKIERLKGVKIKCENPGFGG